MNNNSIDDITRILRKPNEIDIAKITLNSSSQEIRRMSDLHSQNDSRILEQSKDFQDAIEENFNNILPEVDFDFNHQFFDPETINHTIFATQNEVNDYRKLLFVDGTPVKKPIRAYNTSAKTGKKSKRMEDAMAEITSNNIIDFEIENNSQQILKDIQVRGYEMESLAINKFDQLRVGVIEGMEDFLTEIINPNQEIIDKLNNFHLEAELNYDFNGVENPMLDFNEVETHRRPDNGKIANAFEEFFKRENLFDELINDELPKSNTKSRVSGISSDLSSAKKQKVLDENYMFLFMDEGIVPEESAENYLSSLALPSFLNKSQKLEVNNGSEIIESNELSSYPLTQNDQSLNLTDKSIILYNSFSGILKKKQIINFNEAIKRAPKHIKAQSFVELMSLASSGMINIKQSSIANFGDILIAQLPN